MSDGTLLRCYNKGCGKEFREDDQSEGRLVNQTQNEIKSTLNFTSLFVVNYGVIEYNVILLLTILFRLFTSPWCSRLP